MALTFLRTNGSYRTGSYAPAGEQVVRVAKHLVKHLRRPIRRNANQRIGEERLKGKLPISRAGSCEECPLNLGYPANMTLECRRKGGGDDRLDPITVEKGIGLDHRTLR